jgi:hypothetical protein
MNFFTRTYDRRTAIALMASPIAAAALGTLFKPGVALADTLVLYDFEAGTTGGWSVSGPGTSAIAAANSQAAAYTGTHSLAITLSNATSTSWGSGWVVPPGTVGPGAQLSVWVKVPTAGLNGGIAMQDGNSVWSNAAWAALPADSSWHQLTYTVPASAVTPLRWVGVWFAAQTGVVWNGTVLIDTFQALSAAQVVLPPAPPSSFAPPFPRLATIYSKTDENTVAGKQLIAKHNLFVTSFDWAWLTNSPGVPTGQTLASYLKQLNPMLVLLVYYHSSTFVEGDYSWFPGTTGYVVNNVTYHIDLNWYLMYAGSSLASSITSTATSIAVGDLSKFNVNDRAIIGGFVNGTQPEMVLVTAKSAASGSGNLTVQRGINSQNGKFPAISHNNGEWVRSVAYVFGTPSAMAMNVTSTCPATNINPTLGNQSWSQFVGSFVGIKFSEGPGQYLDGVFLDNYVDRPLELPNNLSRIDINNTNTASGITDTQWATGMYNLAGGIRSHIPSGKLVLGNPGGRTTTYQGLVLNGGMIEGLDENGANPYIGDTLGFYNSWMTNGLSPRIFLLDGSSHGTSLSAVQTNYKAVRFELTWTLANDGFFIYDEYWYNYDHASDWWYDEYDNAGQGTGYLGQALGAAAQPISGVFRRDFANGISLCNTTAASINIALGGTFRKIKGTQAPTINDGSTVTSVTLNAKDGIILLR